MGGWVPIQTLALSNRREVWGRRGSRMERRGGGGMSSSLFCLKASPSLSDLVQRITVATDYCAAWCL